MKKLLFLISMMSPVVALQEPDFDHDFAELKQEWNAHFSPLKRKIGLLNKALESGEIKHLQASFELALQLQQELSTYITQDKDSCTYIFVVGLMFFLTIQKDKIAKAIALYEQLTP